MASWDRVRVQVPNARRALIAGVIATLVMTGVMYLGALILPNMRNIPSMVGAVMAFNKHLTTSNALWTWGVVMYAIFYAYAFPLCYAYWIYSYLPGPGWFRGFLSGVFLWFLLELLFMPLLHQGVFDIAGPDTATEIISMFIVSAVYGLVLGFIAGPQEVWETRQHQTRTA